MIYGPSVCVSTVFIDWGSASQGSALVLSEVGAMKSLHVTLFGKLTVRHGDGVLGVNEPQKAQELFCYLLLHRDQPCAREALASLLWGDHCTTSQSKAYLRKALWQLLTALRQLPGGVEMRLLRVEPEWIQLNTIAELWLDVAVFKQAYQAAKGIPGPALDASTVRSLEAAVHLYSGDLLGNWYHEWCLCEREWLYQVYLIMLEKLMAYKEACGAYEEGLAYGERILQHDRAHEQTHRHLMRLRHLAGDRTGALRQYERCVAALDAEFDAAPSVRTDHLYKQVLYDQLGETPAPMVSPEALACLRRVQADLAEMQRHVRQVISASEQRPPQPLPPMEVS